MAAFVLEFSRRPISILDLERAAKRHPQNGYVLLQIVAAVTRLLSQVIRRAANGEPQPRSSEVAQAALNTLQFVSDHGPEDTYNAKDAAVSSLRGVRQRLTELRLL
jgi:Na+-transporting methylmalonyl-CoA/oxaloacetate decarboxylase gamma subunit